MDTPRPINKPAELLSFITNTEYMTSKQVVVVDENESFVTLSLKEFRTMQDIPGHVLMKGWVPKESDTHDASIRLGPPRRRS